MSTLTTIQATDIISASRAVINANFAALNADKVDVASTYADPPWLTSVAGSKVTGDIAGGAARLTTPRTIAGVAFDGTANIAIPYSGLTGAPALAPIATSGSASDLSAGTVPAARGGAGAVNGILRANGSGVVSAAVAGTDFVVPAGNVATATALQTARTIAGVSFNGTANIAIPSTGLSDSADLVRGAAALSTAGCIPFVSSAGVLTGEARIAWDAAGNVLNVGTNATAASMGINIRSTNAFEPYIAFTSAGGYTSGIVNRSSGQIQFQRNGATYMAVGTTGRLLLGGVADDGANQLQVAGNIRVSGTSTPSIAFGPSSGSTADAQIYQIGDALVFARRAAYNVGSFNLNGTWSLWNEQAVTGSTSLIVRAGAGQGVGALTTWQTAAGSAVARMAELGFFWRGSAAEYKFQMYADGSANSIFLSSDAGFSWKPGTNVEGGGGGIALRRQSATNLAIMDSPTGTDFRDLRIRDLITTLATPASATAPGVAGTWEADANYIYICVATNQWKRVAISTW